MTRIISMLEHLQLRSTRLLAGISVILAISACGSITGAPDLAFQVSPHARNADFPALLAQPDLTAALAGSAATPLWPGSLAARAASLRARAARLNAPVLTAAERAQLLAAANNRR